MPSTILFLIGTLLLSLNLLRPFGLAVSDWFFFGALGFALMETFTADRSHTFCWWRNRFLWAIALILLGGFLSMMNSQDRGVAVVEIAQQIFVLTLFVSLAWILARRGMTNTIVTAFILSGGLTAAVALVDYLTGSRFGPLLSGRPDLQLWGRFAGTLGHPNKQGYFLVLTTLLSMGQVLAIGFSRRTALRQIGWCALTLVQAIGIYISGSVDAYLGLIAGLVILVLSSKNVFQKMTRFLGAVTVVLILTLWSILAVHLVLADDFPVKSDNIVSQAIVRVQTNTAESRLVNYFQAWDQIVQNPLIGVGYDQISTSNILPTSRYLDYSVHNALLQTWYTGGFFAFAGWMLIYAWIGKMIFSAIRKGNLNTFSPLILSLAAASLAILLMDQFQDAIYQREKWLVIGLLAAAVWEQKRAEGPADGMEESLL